METITRAEFTTMEDNALIEACIGPTVRRVMGKSLTDKLRLTGGLTGGQRALLMFRMLQGHSGGGTLELFRQLSYLLIHKGVWLGFKKGLKSFGDAALGRLADRLEKAWTEVTASGSGLDNRFEWEAGSGMSADLEPLDRDLREKMPGFVRSVAVSIRKKPDEYIIILE